MLSIARRRYARNPYGVDLNDPTLELYAHLWHPDCQVPSGSTFKSLDLNHHTCTNTGVTWGSTGGIFGGDDYITVPDTNSLDVGTQDFTVIVWAKPSTPEQTNSFFIDKRDSGSPYKGFCMYFKSTDSLLRFQVNDGDQTLEKTTDTGVDIDDGTWRMYGVSVDRDSATGGLFTLNGAQIGTGQDFTASEKTISNAVDIKVGKDTILGSEEYEGILGIVVLYIGISFTENQFGNFYQKTKWRY